MPTYGQLPDALKALRDVQAQQDEGIPALALPARFVDDGSGPKAGSPNTIEHNTFLKNFYGGHPTAFSRDWAMADAAQAGLDAGDQAGNSVEHNTFNAKYYRNPNAFSRDSAMADAGRAGLDALKRQRGGPGY